MGRRINSIIHAFTILAIFNASVRAGDPDAMITIDAGRPIHSVSRYMTGACLEDVNHEVYGGIWSQMIFGESFQEPSPAIAPRGFTAFGGDWKISDGQLLASAGDGPKLVADDVRLASGEVGVEILFPDSHAGNAGLLLNLRNPATGADRFIGYEVSLDSRGLLVLGRHRNNWEPIREVACQTPVNQWISLRVKIDGPSVQAIVDGKPVLDYTDRAHPLPAGGVALRTWQRAARFRNLSITTSGKTRQLPFVAADLATSGALSALWKPIARGSAHGSYALQTRDPFKGAQSQIITFSQGAGEIGIENKGLNRWGMAFVAGKPYEGRLWARAKERTSIVVALESADGQSSYARATLEAKPGDWQRLDFSLTPRASDSAGRFAILLTNPGSIEIGSALLQPGPWGRFKNLPVRKDVADALVAEGITVLRYGGSMINDPEYRWKKMIGPRDRRPPYKGTWYAYASNGWGILDFLNFCEAAGFRAVPDLDVNESPRDIADFIEYVNGPATSPWGRRRAQDGHPAPYALHYIELGNEEAVDDAYWKKFKPLAQAIWSKDPSVIPVVGDFAYEQRITDPFKFEGAPRITSLKAHQQILDFARSQHKPVWFDVHIWNDGPADPALRIAALGDFIDWLGKISPGADYKICIFEENANNHSVRRALAHAITIGGLQRLSDKIPIVCCANCLQCDGQNDNGWDQGLLFLNPAKVWLQPPGYVTQMASNVWRRQLLNVEVSRQSQNAHVNGADVAALDVTALADPAGQPGGKSGLTLQVTNLADRPIRAKIQIDHAARDFAEAHCTDLSGNLLDVNTAKDPDRVAPKSREAAIEHNAMTYTFAPRSFTVIQCGDARKTEAPQSPASQPPTVRAARSVHLHYPGNHATAFYNELTVEQSVPGSYFMACGFDAGYFGLQELGGGKKVVLFSVWDNARGNDARSVPVEQRVEVLYQAKDVRVRRFGGEGTGGQCFFDYDWKIGQTYRLLVTAKPDGKKTTYAGWFYLPEHSQWKHLVSFRTITGGRALGGLYSFIEDFRRDGRSANQIRRAQFANAWLLDADSHWNALLAARFTASSSPWEAKQTIDAGTTAAGFYLQTGGDTQSHEKLGALLTRQASNAKPPDIPGGNQR